MKITTFNPQIIAKDAEPIVKFFEELGFEKKHAKSDFEDVNVIGYRLSNADGFKLDISQTDNPMLPVDAMVSIRMNVDNFDEVYELLTARGFKNIYGDKPVAAASSRSAIMIASSGFSINIAEHIKK